MTDVEKELLAQQADLRRWWHTARTIREYVSTGPMTQKDVVRADVFARAFGWERLPGWRLVRPRLPRTFRKRARATS